MTSTRWLKARGFPPSRAGFPVSRGVAHKSWTWVSYTSSTGLNSPEPQGTGLLTEISQLYDTRSLADLLKTVKLCRRKVPLCGSSHKRTCHSSPCLKGRGLLARGGINLIRFRSHDKVVAMQATDFVGPPGHSSFAPLG